jgi:gamma-glutamyltranspeptidase/glutathione hydrolase
VAERTTWIVDRTEAVASGGMVAAKSPWAAAAGAEVLRRGGNAIDAAVATSFAIGVAEPWMSGTGGGGFMVINRPGHEPVYINFPMISPRAATPDMFPLAGAAMVDGLGFGWPGVVDDANISGPRSVTVPGNVSGMAVANEQFGTMPWADLIAPAIQLATDGPPVTWHTTLRIANVLGTMQKFGPTMANFCPTGVPPATVLQTNPARLAQPDLARTLGLIASEGPRAFYEGETAQAIVRYLAERGGILTEEDFASYQAQVLPALTTTFAGHTIATTGGGTGGTSFIEGLNLLSALGVGELEHNSVEALHRMTQAFRQAFADRFAYLADPAQVDVPLAVMTDPAYAAEQAARFPADRLGTVAAGSAERMGVSHGLAGSMAEYAEVANQISGESTTHFSVIDGDGVAVSVTQTLLSVWGSFEMAPGTGVLLNNGMMWFDPVPGRPNSIGGGKAPLANMTPFLIVKDGQSVASIGSSGGRKIMNCHAQLAMNVLNHGLSMQPAISAPRIDASTSELLLSARIPAAVVEQLAAMGHRVAVRDETLMLGEFASPTGVLIDGDGNRRGGVDPYYYPAAAAGV